MLPPVQILQIDRDSVLEEFYRKNVHTTSVTKNWNPQVECDLRMNLLDGSETADNHISFQCTKRGNIISINRLIGCFDDGDVEKAKPGI